MTMHVNVNADMHAFTSYTWVFLVVCGPSLLPCWIAAHEGTVTIPSHEETITT
jgi:hypothetical protein